jgi:hypothetical protein
MSSSCAEAADALTVPTQLMRLASTRVPPNNKLQRTRGGSFGVQ